MKIPTFAAYMDHSRRLRDIYVDIAKNNRIVHGRIRVEGEEKTSVDCDTSGPYGDLIRMSAEVGPACLSDLFLNSQVFGFGPKVFAPKDAECFALEQVRPKLTLNDYHQPYPTFVIELPEEYKQKRSVNGESPLCVFLHRSDFFLLSAVVWTSAEATVRLLIARADRTIEQLITVAHGRTWDGSLPTNTSEEEVTENCVRLGVNACLLLTMYGVKRLGYANPSHAARLERWIKNGKKEAKAELDAMPQMFGFEQNVRLYRGEVNAGAGGTGHSGSKSFHWRAGHLRMQAHGPGNTLRKQIFVAPMMIRADLMAADPADTIVRYT